MQPPRLALRSRFVNFVMRRPLIALMMLAALLGSGFIAAKQLNSAVKSSIFWLVHSFPECAGVEMTLPTQAPDSTPPVLIATPISSSLEKPLAITSLPNGSLLVAQKAGQLIMLDPVSSQTALVADLSSIVGSSVDNGLYSVVAHPRFGLGSENRIYLFYNRQPDLSIVVASAHLTEKGQIFPGDLQILQIIPHVSPSHSGGAMRFLPDGQLLVSVGDDKESANAQDLQNLLGKLVLVDPDVPFKQPVVAALGLRNPTQVSLSPNDDSIWISDVGNNCIEEVNRISLNDLQRVTNFGWPRFEGNLEHKTASSGVNTEVETVTDAGRFTAPTTSYAHENGACAVIGGALLADWYIFADLCDGVLRGLPKDAAPGTKAARLFDMNSTGSRVGVFSVAGDQLGRVWVLDGWGGRIYRLDIAP